MIRLMFISAYPMEEQIDRILANHSFPEEIEYKNAVYICFDLDGYQQEWPCDALITRGYNADVLEAQGFPFPICKMNFTSNEAVNAIIECRDKYRPEKIAVVCHPSLSLASETISKISGVPIAIYTQNDPFTQTRELVEQAIRDGCDIIIGGGSTWEIARRLHANAHMVKSDDETVWNAIDKAIKTVIIQRQERERTEILQKVMDNSREGLMLIDSHGFISVCNQFTARTLGNGVKSCVGTHFISLLSEFAQQFNRVQQTQQPIHNEIFSRGDNSFSSTFTPLVVGKNMTNTLFSFTDIGFIQEMETQIRNKLFAKGMVTRYTFDDIIHSSERLTGIIETAKRFAQVDSNVLVEGETGTGKEMFAQSIHAHSARARQPFVAVNCTVLPEHLLESELFGYGPGAFTGASKEGKRGLFELAHGGTLFLDEVSEIPYTFQGKLLRVLQEREIRRIGDDKIIPVNVRVIAATNRNLLEMAERGEFRKDLYFRLDILEIMLPPLRERQEDILPLFISFVREFSEKFDRPAPVLSKACQTLLENHGWSGNIRELRNIAERLVVLWDRESTDAGRIIETMLAKSHPSPSYLTIRESPAAQERRRILAALAMAPNRQEAAVALNMSRSTLWRKMKNYRLG